MISEYAINIKLKLTSAKRHTPTGKIVGKNQKHIKNPSEKIVSFAKLKPYGLCGSDSLQDLPWKVFCITYYQLNNEYFFRDSENLIICESLLLLPAMGGLPGSDIVTLLCNETVYYIVNLVKKFGKHWKLEATVHKDFAE